MWRYMHVIFSSKIVWYRGGGWNRCLPMTPGMSRSNKRMLQFPGFSDQIWSEFSGLDPLVLRCLPQKKAELACAQRVKLGTFGTPALGKLILSIGQVMPWVSPWLCYGCECFTSQIFHDFDLWAWVSRPDILPTGGCACANCVGSPLPQHLAAPFMYTILQHNFRIRKGWPCALHGGTQVQTEHGFVSKSITPQCHDDVVLWVHAAHMIYTWTSIIKERPIYPSQEETRRQMLWHPSLRRRKSAEKDQTRYR